VKPTWRTIYSYYISLILFKIYARFGPDQVHHESGMQVSGIPACQLYRITNTKCRINRVVPPDDGIGKVRNM